MKIYNLAVLLLSAVASIEANEQACPAGSRSLREGERPNSRRLMAETIIDNGVVMLGINDDGNLNVGYATVPDAGQPGFRRTGLKFLQADNQWYDSTAYGCECEGFGVSAMRVSDGTSFWGGANENFGGTVTLIPQPIVGTASSATTVADVVGGPIRITHDFFPSPVTSNLYEVEVTILNTSPSETLTNLRYRRAMDWDIPFVIYNECVSIFYGSQPDSLEYATDNGFVGPNPLVDASTSGTLINCPTGAEDCPAYDEGPVDHGALFQYLFKEDDGVTNVSLRPGEELQFTIFYGAADNKAAADAAVAAVGAEIVSYGYPGINGCSKIIDGSAGTYIFGFKDVGAPPIFSESPSSSPTVDCTNKLDPFVIKFSCEILNSLSEQSQLDLCRIEEIYEHCPGLCDPELCPCEDNPFPFKDKRRLITCAEVGAKPPRDQEKDCKKKAVRENCPGICKCNPLGPCDDYPFPFFIRKNPKLCADIAALPEADREKECKNKTVKKYCEATCKCATDSPTLEPVEPPTPRPKPTPRPTRERPPTPRPTPCVGDNPFVFDYPGGATSCERVASLKKVEKDRFCSIREVRKNCPCTCPEPCKDIDSPEPITIDIGISPVEDDRIIADPDLEPDVIVEDEKLVPEEIIVRPPPVIVFYCADLYYYEPTLKKARCELKEVRAKCPCACGLKPFPTLVPIEIPDNVDKLDELEEEEEFSEGV